MPVDDTFAWLKVAAGDADRAVVSVGAGLADDEGDIVSEGDPGAVALALMVKEPVADIVAEPVGVTSDVAVTIADGVAVSVAEGAEEGLTLKLPDTVQLSVALPVCDGDVVTVAVEGALAVDVRLLQVVYESAGLPVAAVEKDGEDVALRDTQPVAVTLALGVAVVESVSERVDSGVAEVV